MDSSDRERERERREKEMQGGARKGDSLLPVWAITGRGHVLEGGATRTVRGRGGAPTYPSLCLCQMIEKERGGEKEKETAHTHGEERIERCVREMCLLRCRTT